MAEAKITVSYSPREFDLMRRVLDQEQKRAFEHSHASTDVKVKHAERGLASELGLMLEKLQ